MNYLPVHPNKPEEAPKCWGRQFLASDRECQGCPYQFSCKETFSSDNGIQTIPRPPVYSPYPAQPQQAQPVFTVPPPATYYQQPRPAPYSPTPSATPYQVPVVPQGGYVPIQNTQRNPNGPVDFSAQVLGQYPGETLLERVSKNMVLRAVEAMFVELVRLFHHWTWPKRGR